MFFVFNYLSKQTEFITSLDLVGSNPAEVTEFKENKHDYCIYFSFYQDA